MDRDVGWIPITLPRRYTLVETSDNSETVLVIPRKLPENYHCYVDGTFKVAPNLFSQVYIILCKYLDGVHPLIYAFLLDKKNQTYERLFKVLIELKPGLKPKSIACDFEQAAIKAIKNNFPEVQIHGCLFHLTKNFRIEMGDLDLFSKYKNDVEFSIYIKMILDFVKVDDIYNSINSLYDELPEEIFPLLEWFEENYIGTVIRNRRRSPRFPPIIWNVHDRVLNKEDRTNNNAEAANRRLNLQMAVDHSTLWAFISCLRRIQSGRDTFFRQLETGKSPPKRKKNTLTSINGF
ncbi:hypothetical protein AGLY_014028 [Aphis glycines]|uniref:MULE transposase domain-containing protein n=1 Tax=Aphis glycines TaxID=307491 RepID=A0A6G0T556_APHGL|nr:hypothetical protein AGLY_014028 [Aphis glycines]